MVPYVIGHITVRDPQKWAEYRSKVPTTLAPWGAQVMLRGTLAAVLSGVHKHGDVVIIRFATIDDVTGWYNSETYQSLIPLRTEAAEMELMCYQSEM